MHYLEPDIMAHVRTDVRCAQCATDHQTSTPYYEEQLEAALYHPQAVRAARRAGSHAAALENAATAHADRTPRSRVPQKRHESAATAAVGRTRLPPACGGCP